MKTIHTLCFFALMIASLFTAGCFGGPKPIKTDYIEGTVTYQESPVTKASVSFSPVEKGKGNPAYGLTDESGKFKLQTVLGAPDKGTTPGEYVVTVSKTENVPTGRFGTDMDGNKYEVSDVRYVTPEHYNSVATSPLRATVTAGGPNVFDFKLQDKPK